MAGTQPPIDLRDGVWLLRATGMGGAELALDIKPGSCPNSYNNKGTGNSKLPVALVGTDGIDVTMVDLDSLLLSRADGVGSSVAPLMGPPGPGITISDTATPFYGGLCDCHELEGDGIPDLNMKFHGTTMTNVLELGSETGMVELAVSGEGVAGRALPQHHESKSEHPTERRVSDELQTNWPTAKLPAA